MIHIPVTGIICNNLYQRFLSSCVCVSERQYSTDHMCKEHQKDLDKFFGLKVLLAKGCSILIKICYTTCKNLLYISVQSVLSIQISL